MCPAQLRVAAVVKLHSAARTIEQTIAQGGLPPAQIAVLRQVEGRLVLPAKWNSVSLEPGARDVQKRDLAAC